MYYWLVLLAVIVTYFFKKKDSRFYLFTAFYIFCVGVLLRIMNLTNIAEILMRISLICWVMGLGLAIKEFN